MPIRMKFRDKYALLRMQMAANACAKGERDEFDAEMHRSLSIEIACAMDVAASPVVIHFEDAYHQAILDCEVKLWHWVHEAVARHDIKLLLGIEREMVRT